MFLEWVDLVKQKVIFLDRDGVICKEKSYVISLDEIEIFDYTRECIEIIHSLGYLAVVITNQSAVAKGLMAEEKLIEINDYIQKQTLVDKIYYCPHYNQDCNCRKPKIGLLEKAIKDFDLDLTDAYFVGDRASDILTGQNIGIKTVLLESGYGTKRLEEEVLPDYILKDLKGFVDLLKRNN